MATRNTGTAIQVGGENATLSHLSTNIIVKVDGAPVGAIQSISFTESRPIQMISEVGTDGAIDSAPSKSVEISGSVDRIRYNGKRLTEAFGRPFIHISSQRIPFDIEIQDIFVDSDVSNAVITVLENVWFDNMQYSYEVGNYIISEKANFKCERIKSFLNNNNVITSVSNGNGSTIILNQFEQEADRGAFTGALDAAGLLNAFISDPRN